MELDISSNAKFVEATGNVTLTCPEHMNSLEGDELRRALSEKFGNMYIIAAGFNPETRLLEFVTANFEHLTLHCDEGSVPSWYENMCDVFPALGGKKLIVASKKVNGSTVILDSSKVIDRANKGYKLSALCVRIVSWPKRTVRLRRKKTRRRMSLNFAGSLRRLIPQLCFASSATTDQR